MELNEIIKKFNEVYKETEDIEKALSNLKDIGATQMECLKVLKSELGLSIAAADKIVLNSKAWNGSKNGVLSFREKFESYLNSKCK